MEQKQSAMNEQSNKIQQNSPMNHSLSAVSPIGNTSRDNSGIHFIPNRINPLPIETSHSHSMDVNESIEDMEND